VTEFFIGEIKMRSQKMTRFKPEQTSHKFKATMKKSRCVEMLEIERNHSENKTAVFVPPNTIERRDCKIVPSEYIDEVEKHFTNASSTQIGIMIARLIDLTTVVCFKPKDYMAYGIDRVCIIDDAVHLVIDPKAPF
jgi:hypothetical protein